MGDHDAVPLEAEPDTADPVDGVEESPQPDPYRGLDADALRDMVLQRDSQIADLRNKVADRGDTISQLQAFVESQQALTGRMREALDHATARGNLYSERWSRALTVITDLTEDGRHGN